MAMITKRTLCPQLDQEDIRILVWLLVYPASATAEVAFAFGIHRTTASRALARMQQAGFVTNLCGYGGEARFLLTSSGTALLGQGMAVDGDDLARAWQCGLSAPARLIPRLATIDRLHTFARGFFQHAPVQLARQGHAAIVRWHVIRDWRARVVERRGRSIIVRAEAQLSWTVEDSRDYALSAWAQAHLPPRAGRWEAAFVFVESGLCDADLIRARLSRLLALRKDTDRSRWHEPVSAFPPVLILIQNERELEVWRRAAQAIARAAGAAPLCGAIAIQGTGSNPWQWGWRDLTSGASIRLASLFTPLPAAALPPGITQHIAEVQRLMRSCADRCVSSDPPIRRPCLALPAVLSPRDRDLLTLLCRAPDMTAGEIAAVRGTLARPLADTTAERALRDLAHQGLAERRLVAEGTCAAWRWQLTERGLRTVAAMHDAPLLHLNRVEERDRYIHARQSQHLAGVYATVAAFCRAAQEMRGAVTVRWWETGRGCERTYWYHGVQRNLRPDAELLLIFPVAGSPRHLRCWIEYDRGTMNRHDLARKMGAYHDYWEAKEWAADGYAALPRLLFIVPEHGQEERLRQACQECLGAARLRVLVTTAAHLAARTPFGCIWRQVWPEFPENEQRKRRALWE